MRSEKLLGELKIHALFKEKQNAIAGFYHQPPLPLFFLCSRNSGGAKNSCLAEPTKSSWRLSKLTGLKSVLQSEIIATCL